VMEAAERSPRSERAGGTGDCPFTVEEIAAHLRSAARAFKASEHGALVELGGVLDNMAENSAQHAGDLESLEQRLTALEEKAVAILRVNQTEEALFELRRQLNEELRMFRSKMTADQISALERRYLDTALLERANLPRLSLFYLH
jgi:hypothetical protein